MAISDLRGIIDAKIKTNGSQSITGAVLNEVLNEMVNELDVASELKNKVDKEFGKGLSTNDFTTSEKEKLAELENYDDAELRGEVESLQTEVDSHDVAIEDLQDNKVDKGDYAPALTAGFADNLVSKDVVVDSEFNLRRSGGGAISDGVARMEVVKGNSVVWNQRFAPRNYTSGGIATTYQDGEYHSVGQTTGSFFSINTFEANELNHKYLFVVNGLSSSFNGRFALLNRSGSGEINNGFAYIFWNNSNPAQGTHIGFDQLTAETAIDETYTVVQHDLTQMFGAGNEPTTIEEFYARKPIVEDEYAYNEGEVIHCNVDAVKSVGRNVWDEEWELGAYNSNNGEKHATTSKIRNVNPISVLPNQKYYIAGPISHVYFYDVDYQYIKNTYTGGIGAELQIPINAAFLNFESISNVVTYNHDICINLSDPDFNGQYEPYKEDVRELPSAIKEVFPNGMMSAGTAHDVAYNDSNKEVGVTEKRIGVVDLGTFPWYKNTDGYKRVLWKAANLNKLGIAPKNNILCDRYVAKSTHTIYYDAVKGININSEANGVCFLYDSQYDDYDAASFKAAMAGVMLYYELAEPIVTEHQEPFNLDYQVTNGGQEQAMATEPTSAFKAEIAYGFNASAKIKENANEIAQLKATIAQLQAALASMVNANVEDYE